MFVYECKTVNISYLIYCTFLICVTGLKNMDPEPTMEQLNDEDCVSEKLDEACDMDTEDVALSRSLMLSVSPELTVKSADLPLDLSSLQTKPLKISCFDSRQHDHCLTLLSDDSPLTPKDAIFDPFASGPDRHLLAPFCRKCRTSTCIFSSSMNCKGTEQCASDGERISENRMMEVVYEDLLEAIISKRADEIADSNDGCATPTFENLLNDVAEACPDAPARTAENLKNTSKMSSKKKLVFNTGLFRKIEF